VGTQPILDMVVTIPSLRMRRAPVFLTFAGDVEPGEPFGAYVENRHLIVAVWSSAAAAMASSFSVTRNRLCARRMG